MTKQNNLRSHNAKSSLPHIAIIQWPEIKDVSFFSRKEDKFWFAVWWKFRKNYETVFVAWCNFILIGSMKVL